MTRTGARRVEFTCAQMRVSSVWLSGCARILLTNVEEAAVKCAAEADKQLCLIVIQTGSLSLSLPLSLTLTDARTLTFRNVKMVAL